MFEIIVRSATKTVPTEGAVSGVINQIQAVFDNPTIEVFEVKPTYDGKTAGAKEVGAIRSLKATYPEAK